MPENPPSIIQLLRGVFPFSNLDQKTLEKVSPFFEKTTLPAGANIFFQGQDAKGLYFILVGEVEITREDIKGKRTIAQLRAGDHFGEDALTRRHASRTTAAASSRVILVRICRENITSVVNASPMLYRIFDMFRRSYHLQLNLELPWHQPAETLYLISRRHSFFLWVRLIPILLVTLGCFGGLFSLAFSMKAGAILWSVLAFFVLGFGCLFAAWAGLEWVNDYFILTRDRVLMQRLVIGVFDSRSETPMSAILSTGMDAPFFGRLLGFGAVTARAYTGDLRLNQLPDPDLILAYLEYRRTSLVVEQRREERSAMQSMLQARLQPGQKSQAAPAQRLQYTAVNYYAGTFLDALAKFFGLRYEKEGAIIYRTHWWILVKRTLLPFVFMLLVMGLVVATFAGAIPYNSTLIYLLAIVLIIIGFLWWLYNYIDWRNDVYIINGDQLIDINRRPLGSEEKRSAPVKNIQTVEYKRSGIISLMLDFGTVRIQIGNEELTFDNVYKPSVVQIEIFNHLREFNEHMKKIEQKRMVDWISTYDEIRNGEDQKPKR